MGASIAGPSFAQGGGDLTPPSVITHVDAVYPPGAVPSGKHVDVNLAVTIDADGNVSKVEVTQSGGKDLDDAAINAVRQWKFQPATRNGQPIASRIRVPFHFAPLHAPTEVKPEPQAEAVVPGHVVHPDAERGGVTGPAEGALHGEREVIVRGRTIPPSRGASDFQVEIGELKNVPRQNAADMLRLAPGVLLTNAGGAGHAEQVFMRGFDAREGQDIEFTVDGIPINDAGNLHGNGYADTHFLIPELVESLRILEGPFDPRQGNYAVAGSADYHMALARRGLTAKYSRGSFDSERMLLLWGPNKESTHTFAGVELYRTAGFGANRDAKRGSVMAQYEGRLSENSTFRLSGTAFSMQYHSAGLVRQDDYERGRIGFYDTYDPRQGGDSARYSVAADVESKTGATTLRQQVFFIDRSMRLRENFTGFLLDVQTPIQSLHGQRGDLLDLSFSGTTVGTRGSATHRTKWLDLSQEFEFGYFARGDSTKSTQYRIEAATNAPYRLETDLESKLGDLGLYADASLKFFPWLSLRGGARADMFAYDALNRCAVDSVAHPSRANPPGDASCLSQQDFGRYREPVQRSSTASMKVMPRATILVGPIQHLTFSTSYGTGVRSIDPIYITNDTDTPFASIQSYEGGVSYQRSFGEWDVNARSVLFHTHVDRDLIFSETAGRNTLSNGTARNGWVGAGRITGPFVDEALNVTLVKSTFDDTGLLVPYVPDVVVRSETAVFRDLPWTIAQKKIRGTISAGLTFVGKRPLPYGVRSAAYFLADASASLEWSAFELSLTATNLLDRRYALGEFNFPSDFSQAGAATSAQPTLVPMRHFAAGAPRTIFASLAITLGGP